MNQVIQAHGANTGAMCSVCQAKSDPDELQKGFNEGTVIYCQQEECKDKKHPIKPNVVFYGEELPANFIQNANPEKLKEVDLVIVIGTALAVAPFNKIPFMVPKHVPQVLFNMLNTASTGSIDFAQPGSNKLFV